ncbi:MAG: outer membrane lipoprotein-sorting protein [Flavobacteriaceae bacterium]|nr:outer membrane lipoprotein-sorting protein [Flavobacteriaceae bacterium]
MKTIKTLLLAVLFMAVSPILTAQTAEEIVANYFENTGGLESWNSIESIKYDGKVDLGGMVIPFTRYVTKDGKSATTADVQGQMFYQDVFDGETLWGTNQMTMSAEKSDAESTANYKMEAKDLISPLLGYKEKGYSLELLGTETVEGTETFKLKLDTEPYLVDGAEQPNSVYFYFDTENFVPIIEERTITSGPAKGMVITLTYSDYEEVDGIYFPFSMTQGVKDQPGGQTLTMTAIELNGDFDDSVFTFPEPAVETDKK